MGKHYFHEKIPGYLKNYCRGIIMMKKKSLILTLIAVLTFTMCAAGLAFAATESDLRNDLDDVEAAQDELSKKMAQIEKDVKEMQKKVDNLNYMISQTASEISNT